MEKKLPKVFVNKIDKILTNNERVSYGAKEKLEEKPIKVNKKIIEKSNLDINQKIKSIFNSPGYIYKANVNIKLNDGIVNKQIIGQNKTHLITIENELIAIKDVIDIDFAN